MGGSGYWRGQQVYCVLCLCTLRGASTATVGGPGTLTGLWVRCLQATESAYRRAKGFPSTYHSKLSLSARDAATAAAMDRATRDANPKYSIVVLAHHIPTETKSLPR